MKKFNVLLYSYILMDNHYHLLIETLNPNLSRFMHHLHTSYTVYFNIKYKRAGHLFQGRYQAILIERENYLLELLRYIVLNPVRAGITSDPFKYPWSSLNLIKERNDFLYTDWLKEYFGENWKDKFTEFIKDGISMKSPFKKMGDSLFLGSEDFIKKMMEKKEKRGDKTKISYREVIEAVSRYFNVSEKELIKRRRNFFPRKVAIYLTHFLTQLRTKEIARIFNLTPEGISKSISRLRESLENSFDIKKDIGKITELITRR